MKLIFSIVSYTSLQNYEETMNFNSSIIIQLTKWPAFFVGPTDSLWYKHLWLSFQKFCPFGSISYGLKDMAILKNVTQIFFSTINFD